MNGQFIIEEPGRRPESSYYHVGDGYYYNYQNDRERSIYFRCNRSVCGGRANFNPRDGFIQTQPHNHAPDVMYDVQNARHRILQQARSLAYRSPSDIIAIERSRIPNRLVRSRLTLRRLRPAIIRARSEIFPNIPQNLSELTNILQDPAWVSLSETKDFADSIYLGSTWGQDLSHNIIFITRRCLAILKEVPIIFADGTFYISPSVNGCYQVFTLVTIYGHTVIPLCWCLMESKSQDAYIAVLTLLRNHMRQWNFFRVICDFEDAIMNAFRIVLQVEVQGCLFHSANAMGQHARVTIGIITLQMFPEIKNIVKLCCALPLLPHHLIQEGLNIIGVLSMNLGDNVYIVILRPYLEYLQYQWLNHPNRGQAMCVCGSEHRTNNASECNNRRMKRKFGAHHPNIFRFIRELTEFEDVAIDDMESLFRGITPSRHRAVSAISNDATIQRLTADLLRTAVPTELQILTFLISASLTMDGVLNEAMGMPLPQ